MPGHLKSNARRFAITQASSQRGGESVRRTWLRSSRRPSADLIISLLFIGAYSSCLFGRGWSSVRIHANFGDHFGDRAGRCDLKTGRLSARKAATTKPGKYSDGGGLTLVVTRTGARKWVLRFMRSGRAREMGLGSADVVTLATARVKALEAHRMIDAGLDPIAERRKARQVPTFGNLADEVRESLSASFRNEKHRQQWKNTLESYAAPLWDRQVDTIDTEDVLSVLKPIWLSKSETASRLRGRIETILSAASARGFRNGENPARWKGHLQSLLPERPKLSRGHHAAMPYEDVPSFIVDLRKRKSTAALALEVCILTATRTGEVLGMRWPELDFEKAVWTIPAARMKATREHRVPLSSRVVEILSGLAKHKRGEFVFSGQNLKSPLSNMALAMQLRRMKIDGATVHGFRSSFRDWAGNLSTFPREVAEAALAHVIGDKAEQAYRRGDALEKRRKLMQAWANYCARSTAKIVNLSLAR